MFLQEAMWVFKYGPKILSASWSQLQKHLRQIPKTPYGSLWHGFSNRQGVFACWTTLDSIFGTAVIVFFVASIRTCFWSCKPKWSLEAMSNSFCWCSRIFFGDDILHLHKSLGSARSLRHFVKEEVSAAELSDRSWEIPGLTSSPKYPVKIWIVWFRKKINQTIDSGICCWRSILRWRWPFRLKKLKNYLNGSFENRFQELVPWLFSARSRQLNKSILISKIEMVNLVKTWSFRILLGPKSQLMSFTGQFGTGDLRSTIQVLWR